VRDRCDLPTTEHREDVALELVVVASERAAGKVTGRVARVLVGQPLVSNLTVRQAPAAWRRRRPPRFCRQLVAQPAGIHQADGAELLPDDLARAHWRRASEIDVAGAIQPALDADAVFFAGHENLLGRTRSPTS